MQLNATPVTVITGFLGSGKTTLINRLLHELHGQRLAVIENEFGAVGIDADILAVEHEETVIQLANGCICCTVRGDLAKALNDLSERMARGEITFDRVIIETTGIADPGPIVQTFLAETTLLTKFYLDGIITLVDSVNLLGQLDINEVKAQIALADRIFFTKTDLVDSSQFETVHAAVCAINPRCIADAIAIHAAQIDVLIDQLFDARGYQFDMVRLDATPRASTYRTLPTSTKPSLLGRVSERPAHTTDVTTFTFETEVPIDAERLEQCMQSMQRYYGRRLWRYKGILQIHGCHQRVVLQGVQNLMQMNFATIWRPYEPRRSVIVFIGQALDQAIIVNALRICQIGSVTPQATAQTAHQAA